MAFFFGGPFGRPPRRGRGRGFGPRGFWGPPPPMGMGYYPRRRFYGRRGNSLLGALGLGALGFFAGRLFGGHRGGGFGGPGGGISGSGGADWGGGGGDSGFGSGGGSFDAGGGSDWGQ